jgi:hypothetical protein
MKTTIMKIDDPSHDSIITSAANLGPMSGIPDDERMANIRLIAAAPALLAACRAQIDEGLCPRNTQRMRAAIALAEGGGE